MFRPRGRQWFNSMVQLTEQDRALYRRLSKPEDLGPVTMVQSPSQAQRILDIMQSLGPHHLFACDTEVADIDVKAVGPVGHGTVTCLSIYGGPDIDFGNGPLCWVDNLDAAEGTLEAFR